MLEFLYITIILFPFFLLLFFIFPVFKYAKITMIIIQFIFSIPLLCNILIKKHSLYNAPRVQYIQSTDFYPIKSLHKIENEDGTFHNISYDIMDNNEFSIIKTDKYSTQCLENYFIKNGEVCPITEIIFDNKASNIYNGYIQISNNEYFYYTNKNKIGKLYKSFDYSDFEENREDSFSNVEIDKIVRKELNKISNPILDFKYFVKFFDAICLILIITSFILSIFEYNDDTRLGMLRIINLVLQFIILIIYIIRFSKFLKVKLFLFDNEDIYKNDSYYPKKDFNFDSVPLAITINIFIINALYIAFPNNEIKCIDKKSIDFLNFKNDCISDWIPKFLAICFFISKIIFEIFDFVNDKNILAIYDNIIYNWRFHPINKISLNYYKTGNYDFSLKWKGYFLNLERLNDFNYINTYPNGNNKLCGKDSLGNNIYFPENIDCPINDIFILNYNSNFNGYTKLSLNNNNYLYYTNETTEGKILIDLRINYDTDIELNPGGYSKINYFSIPFYEELDSDDESYIYSINYLGINSSAVLKDKLENFEKKTDSYNKTYIAKIVLFCFEYILIIISFILYIHKEKYYCDNDCTEKIFYLLGSFAAVLNLINFILIIVCLDYQRKYVINFMNKMNFDFEKNKIDYKWNVAALIHSLFPLIYLILYHKLKEKFEFYGNNYKESNALSSSSGNQNNISRFNNTTDPNINEYYKKIYNDLINEHEKLKGEKQKLENNYIVIQKEKENLEKKINEYKNKNEKESIVELKAIIKTNEEKINELEQNNKNLIEKVNKKKRKLHSLKSSLHFSLEENEKLMCVVFRSIDYNFIEPIICKNTHIFNQVENILYNRHGELKEELTFCLAGGSKVNIYKTLEENNIKDGTVILVYKNNNS